MAQIRRLGINALVILLLIGSVMVLPMAGCAENVPEEEELEVRAITIPTDAVAPVVRGVPRIADELGRGSLAAVKSGATGSELEVMSPKSKLLARAAKNINLEGFSSSSVWSPKGDALVYVLENKALRVMDFSSGEDRLLYASESGVSLGRTGWLPAPGREKVLFQLFKRPSARWELWSIDRDGTNATRVTPRPSDPDLSNWTNIFLFDVSPDGSAALVRLEGEGERGVGRSVVALADLATLEVIAASPMDQEGQPGKFSPDGMKITLEVSAGDNLWVPYVANRDGSELTELSPAAPPPGRVFTVSGFTPDSSGVVLYGHRGSVTDRPMSLSVFNLADKTLRELLPEKAETFVGLVGFSQKEGRLIVHEISARDSRERLAAGIGTLKEVDVASGAERTLATGVISASVAK